MSENQKDRLLVIIIWIENCVDVPCPMQYSYDFNATKDGQVEDDIFAYWETS